MIKTRGKIQAVNFNYQYFLCDLNHELSEIEIFLLTHPQSTLKCEFVQAITRVMYIHTILMAI